MAFAIRLAGSHEAVGIFVASELDELADIVVQFVDPTATEYLVLGPGGICVAQPNAAQWPARELLDAAGMFRDFEPADQDPLKSATLDEYWWRTIDRGDWHPLDWGPALPDEVVLTRTATDPLN